MLAAVQRAGAALQFASAPLRDGREVVVAAVRQIGQAMAYASAALLDDWEVVPFDVDFGWPCVRQEAATSPRVVASRVLKDDPTAIMGDFWGRRPLVGLSAPEVPRRAPGASEN